MALQTHPCAKGTGLAVNFTFSWKGGHLHTRSDTARAKRRRAVHTAGREEGSWRRSVELEVKDDRIPAERTELAVGRRTAVAAALDIKAHTVTQRLLGE